MVQWQRKLSVLRVIRKGSMGRILKSLVALLYNFFLCLPRVFTMNCSSVLCHVRDHELHRTSISERRDWECYVTGRLLEWGKKEDA